MDNFSNWGGDYLLYGGALAMVTLIVGCIIWFIIMDKVGDKTMSQFSIRGNLFIFFCMILTVVMIVGGGFQTVSYLMGLSPWI